MTSFHGADPDGSLKPAKALRRSKTQAKKQKAPEGAF
jgi:hypothetical protein